MLKIKNIVKQYAQHKALDDVSFEIEKGSIFGLLGPNGAGKTSLIRIINQITAPDSGEIIFQGEKLNPNHISKIGYLPEERGLYKKMEIGEQILYLARLKGLSSADATLKVKYWFEKLEMKDWWKKKVEELSKGMQQKVQFVATVLHEPELLILDEPFTGFDPVNAEIITNEILELNKKGTTIIFSTHRMESVEKLCDSIALIHKSKKVLDGKVTEIRNSYRSQTYEIGFSANSLNGNLPSDYSLVSTSNNKMTIKMNSNTSSNDLLKALIPYVEITSFEEIVPSINDIFIQTVTENN